MQPILDGLAFGNALEGLAALRRAAEVDTWSPSATRIAGLLRWRTACSD
jgi:hypothetical protein